MSTRSTGLSPAPLSAAQVAGVAEATIKMSYDDMYPHRTALFTNQNKLFLERLPADYDALLPKPRESPALALAAGPAPLQLTAPPVA